MTTSNHPYPGEGVCSLFHLYQTKAVSLERQQHSSPKHSLLRGQQILLPRYSRIWSKEKFQVVLEELECSGGYRSAPEGSNSKGEAALCIFRGSQTTGLEVQEKTPAAPKKATVAPLPTVQKFYSPCLHWSQDSATLGENQLLLSREALHHCHQSCPRRNWILSRKSLAEHNNTLLNPCLLGLFLWFF